MTEFVGLAYFAEIPVTIINVQRGGPSTGMPTRTQQADLLSCAYASHGDTKHVLLFPEDPKECFDFSATALDLADRLQTPVFVMTDLDIGMNHRLCEPLDWDDSRSYDRGKVMTEAELEGGQDFGRYLDVDGDGIPYRTLPGTHPSKGAYFTRGTTRDAYARYSEAGPDYLYNVTRLLKKFETAKELVPQPVLREAARETRFGAIYFGSTSPAMAEAFDALQAGGVHVDTLRVRAFPVQRRGRSLLTAHETVFVIEQNRDAQLRMMLINEQEQSPAKLEPILHYDGTPITARFIIEAIVTRIRADNVEPIGEKEEEQGAGRMTYLTKPKLHHPDPAEQQAGLHRRDYEGKISTLCAGCGDDSISAALVAGVLGARDRTAPRREAPGIGCWSKTPDVLLGAFARLNTVHSRMPSG